MRLRRRHQPGSGKVLYALLPGVLLLLVGACVSSGPGYQSWAGRLPEGIRRLQQPLPGPMAAFYRLQVGSTRTLRLALLAEGEWGRMTVSESFGSTLSIGAWDAAEGSRILDMREGCRLRELDLSGRLGFSEIPMKRLPLLLGGRLPVEEGDRIEVAQATGEILIHSSNWEASIRLAPDPWRVLELQSGGFVIRLSDHSISVPGRIETRDADGRKIRLDLLRLKWEISRKPGELPQLPICGAPRPS